MSDRIYTELDKIHSKLDKINERIDNVDSTLAKQHESLSIHIYRTNLLEKHIGIIEGKILPIAEHVSYLKSVGKFLLVVLTALGILASILKIFL